MGSIIIIITSIVVFSLVLLFSAFILLMKILQYTNVFGVRIDSWLSAVEFIVSVLIFLVAIDFPIMLIEAIIETKYRKFNKHKGFFLFLLQFILLFLLIHVVDEYISGVTFSTYVSEIAITCVFYIVFEIVQIFDRYVQKKDTEQKDQQTK
ncbi:YrvL family regulatory protein [Collibacillus ludicampi]|uniref:YrvL family regulatory protein n=1 Tax=Collibacillus ludicampi TaxID=2771369 RepID=UPI003F6F623A